ncbi:MAG: hypothetical protein H6Q89_3392 [Myxococcaceae bacterium]|nr:hypothetical protein [Myxococcaceae bacterium]
MTSPLALVILLTAAAADAPRPVVSVLYFENSTGDGSLDVLRKGLADMIITDLVAWDGVTVVERAKLEAVLGELKLQQTKAIDRTTAVKVGKIVGAQYAVTGSLHLSQSKLRVDATVTSIEKGTTVVSASVTDEKDKIFDLEQLLVDKLTAAIDVKLRGSADRKKAKVPSLDALLAYSKAIDLSDQGKIEEAQKAMAAVVSKSPTFVMAREKKQALLKSLEDYELRKKDLITSAVLEVNKRADAELASASSFSSMKPEQKLAVAMWRVVKGRFLARVLKQSLSSRSTSLRVIKVGQEARALAAMRGWIANQRLLLDEVRQLEPRASMDPQQLGLAELLRDSGLLQGSVTFDEDLIAGELTEFVLQGRLTDGDSFNVAPQPGVLDPAEHERALKSLEEAVTKAEAAWKKASPQARLPLEYPFARAALDQGAALEWLRRDDDAAAAYQRILDLIPTSSSARDAEQKIQEIVGAKHRHDRSEREKFEKALRTCEGFHAVGSEIGYRLRRKGLPGLDEIDQEFEKNCGLRFGTAYELGSFFRNLASDAADHEDCVRARRFYLKAFTFGGDGPRSFEAYFKNEPWCNYGLAEADFPSKVRVTSVNQGYRDDQSRAIANGLADLLGEELGARGVAIERGGSSNGGVLGLYASLETKGDVLSISGKLHTDAGEVTFSAPFTKGVLDLNALLAPVLKELRGKSEPGARKPAAKLSLETAAAYGAALDLFEDRKWPEAQAAFDAITRKDPAFRLAAMRSAMVKSRLADR